MTYQELIDAAIAAEKRGHGRLTLDVGARKSPGFRVNLAGASGGPLGELLCVNSRGACVASFEAKSVRRWALMQMAKDSECLL